MHVLDVKEGQRIDRCEMSVFDPERPLPLVIQPRPGERIDLLEGPYLTTNESLVKAFRPKQK